MSNNKIVPWIYKKDEEAELYWLCSPYLSKNNNWMITAVFRRNDEIKMVEIPWGTLPLLRLGQKYINGMPVESKPKGYVGQLKIENEEFQICESFKLPPKLYYLYKNHSMGSEFVCKTTIGNKDYYISCIEIVRSFLAKSKTLANCLLKPNGLDFLIDKVEAIGQSINIFLAKDIPRKLINDDTVAHLLWLKYNKLANDTWTSIYNNIFSTAVEEQPEGTVKRLQTGIKIKAMPPINNNCVWSYRGIYSGNSVLILEIMTTTGFELPMLQKIRYFHQSFDRTKSINNVGVIRRTYHGKEEIYEIQIDKAKQDTKKDVRQPVIELPPTAFVYEEEIDIKRLKGKERFTDNKVTVVKAKWDENGTKLNDTLVGSPQDWSGEGKIPSIDFNSLEIVKGKLGKGLEEFYKAIEYISNNYKGLNIAMSEVFLPKGKKFSFYPDGSRRNCAIVSIYYEEKKQCYIFEMGRSDKWLISTLFIWPTIDNYNLEVEHVIDSILAILMENNGHWNTDALNYNKKIEFYKMKHTSNSTIYAIANRIYEKIGLKF
jgi:hypothetical protein